LYGTSPLSSCPPPTKTPSSSRPIIPSSRSSRKKLISPVSLPTPHSFNNDNDNDENNDDYNDKTTKEDNANNDEEEICVHQNSATATTNDNNNTFALTTTTTTKYWTDTDVLPNGLETNQIPGYMRALS